VYNIAMGTTHLPWRRLIAGAGGAASLAAGAALVARAGLTLDIGVGRRVRPLGPIRLHVAAPPDVVFDVIAAPYLGKTPRAMRGKIEVLERGSDLVLAAHFTPLAGGLTVTTVETVRFERPHRISFRLVKGPVPYVVERYELQSRNSGTDFAYTGELGTEPLAARHMVGRPRGAILGADSGDVARERPHRGRAAREPRDPSRMIPERGLSRASAWTTRSAGAARIPYELPLGATSVSGV
jgi:hypothetical protein